MYDSTGYARLLQPEARGYEMALDVSESMVRVVDGLEP
jgi:hypothetical protein